MAPDVFCAEVKRVGAAMDDSSSSDILNRLRNLPPRSTAAAPQSRYAAAYAESMGRSTNLPYSYGSSVPSASAASKRESLGMYRTTSSEYGVGAATPLSTSPLSSSALPTSSPLSSSALLSSSPLSTSPAARLGRRSYSRHEPAGPTDVLATTPPKYLTSTTLTSSARPGMRLSSSGRLGANEDDSAAGTSTTTPSRTPPSASRSVDFRVPAKTGLANLGNTCFMNSILQCLCATPELLELCYSGSLASQQRRGKLSTELQSLFLKMHESRASKHVSPSAFLSKMQSHDKRFGGRRQHDSQEFFISLLDGVSKETNTVVTKPKYKELSSKGTAEEQSEEAWSYAKSFEDGPVLDVFQGQLQATTKCKKCGHESHCFDPFLDISLPLGSSRGKDVASCFSKFTEIESLSESEGYKCEKCKSGNVSRRILLRRYPPILVVHLKRFSGGSSVSFLSRSPSFSSYSKDSTTIDLRPNDVLDLRDFCVTDGGARCTTSDSVPPRYRLYGISNHFGSMGGGHYTADCRSFTSDSWNHFDDSHVSEGGPKGDGGSAYVLFYRLDRLPAPKR